MVYAQQSKIVNVVRVRYRYAMRRKAMNCANIREDNQIREHDTATA